MWNEVYVRGSGLASTRHGKAVSRRPTHLKVKGHHSWQKRKSVTPLLPLQRDVGQDQDRSILFPTATVRDE